MDAKIIKIADGLRDLPDTPETAAKVFRTIWVRWRHTPYFALMALLALDEVLHFGPLVFSRGVRWAYTLAAQECPKAEVIKALARTDKVYLMTKVERDKLASLPDNVTIYHRRGVKDPRTKGWGLSWSISTETMECMDLLSLAHAKDRAQHFVTTVPKTKILCYFHNREEEVLVDVPEGWPVNEYEVGLPEPEAFAQYLAFAFNRVQQHVFEDFSKHAYLDD